MPPKDDVDTTVQAPVAAAAPGFRSEAPADRFMRRLLGVKAVDRASGEGAHRYFRTSVVISGIRCLITYLVIPVVVPLLALGGWVAAPIGIALCIIAVVNGIVSLKRFWGSDHPRRWMYTVFMAVVFVILAVALIADFNRWGAF